MKIAYITDSRTAGHMMRGYAIQRALDRAGLSGDEVQFRMFGPMLPFPIMRILNWTSDPDWERIVHRWEPDLVIADFFWKEVQGFLAHFYQARGSQPEAWLLLRWYPKDWLSGFYRPLWDHVYAIEPSVETPDRRVPPIVSLNFDEKMYNHFLADEVVQLGDMDHTIDLPKDAIHLTLRYPASSSIFPAAKYLDNAAVIYAHSSYNTYWESRWLGYDKKMVWVPRLYEKNDNVRYREFFHRDYEMKENGADVLVRDILNLGFVDKSQQVII